MKKAPNLKSFWGRAYAQAYAMTVEHNFTNVFRANFHKISERMYRSSQPTTYQLRNRVKKYGIKTVLNLRGYEKNSPLQALEEKTCEELGVKLEYLEVYSRKIPDIGTLLRAKELLEHIEYPAMLHCKSGADRAGLVSTLYLHWMEGVPIEEAGQLKLFPFGHIRYARTGLIDLFFESYLAHKQNEDISLLEWARDRMDRDALQDSFKALPIYEAIVDKILRRE